jgi:hypothetical protein
MAKTADCWKLKFCYQGSQDVFDMTMPIDVRQVDWLYVVILALFALVANHGLQVKRVEGLHGGNV